MHAFLITGTNNKEVDNQIYNIIKADHLETTNYNINRISDVRELISQLKLKRSNKQAIIIKNIHSATPEALNAFLKTLEENSENILYILTAKNTYSVLPTIVSRCTLINVSNKSNYYENYEVYERLLKISVPKRINQFLQINERDKALEFIEKLIHFLHFKMIKEKNKDKYANALLLTNKTYQAINKNGNLRLQLANLAINL